MASAGLYERSGSWLYEVGLPGKSGVSGGMVTVSPGKGAVAGSWVSSGQNEPIAPADLAKVLTSERRLVHHRIAQDRTQRE